eukprot:3704854-Pleurochrysis_carterae.AAC.1
MRLERRSASGGGDPALSQAPAKARSKLKVEGEDQRGLGQGGCGGAAAHAHTRKANKVLREKSNAEKTQEELRQRRRRLVANIQEAEAAAMASAIAG